MLQPVGMLSLGSALAVDPYCVWKKKSGSACQQPSSIRVSSPSDEAAKVVFPSAVALCIARQRSARLGSPAPYRDFAELATGSPSELTGLDGSSKRKVESSFLSPAPSVFP